ncbi:hypothetical protein B566_EDAN007075 [Ephemera danica]|nr:hypothetical protein B566_EDAN007075 [Ephemera danica]
MLGGSECTSSSLGKVSFWGVRAAFVAEAPTKPAHSNQASHANKQNMMVPATTPRMKPQVLNQASGGPGATDVGVSVVVEGGNKVLSVVFCVSVVGSVIVELLVGVVSEEREIGSVVVIVLLVVVELFSIFVVVVSVLFVVVVWVELSVVVSVVVSV